LVGHDGEESTIENSYSTGVVGERGNGIISETTRGGFIGYVETSRSSPAIIRNSYYNRETSGLSSGTGSAGSAGGTSQTTANMKKQSTFVGWDFTNIWGINATINNGYPYLRALETT
jgi:hypothetical protein